MNYNIYIAELSPDAHIQEYAVEIQPPLASVALDGLIKRLTVRSDREYNSFVLAEDVAVVRQDAEGTAFIITSNAGRESLMSAASVGKEVARELNPCDLDLHQMTVSPVEGYYGLSSRNDE